MKKRVFSLIVAVAMLLGMLPVTSLGAGSESAAVVHPVTFTEGVTVNGTLSEAWLLSSKLTGTDVSRKFGSLWDSTALYLAIEKATDTAVTATINGHVLNIAASGVTEGGAAVVGASVAIGETHWEVKIPWTALGVTLDNFNIAVPAKLSAGGASWEGDLLVSSLVRNKTSLSAFGGNHFPNGKRDGMSYEALTDGFRMANVYVEGGATENKNARIYCYEYMDAKPLNGDAMVLEYDFYAEAMPEYCAPDELGTLDGLNACYGFTYIFGNDNTQGFSAGITNTTDGLYLCMNGIVGKTVHAIKLNKGLKETFRVRMERDAEGILRTYVDDVLVDSVEGSFVPGSWGRSKNVLIVNLYSGSDYHLTADKANDVDFTVSNMRYGCTYDDLLKDLSFDDIKGENTAETLIAYDLTLPSSYTHPMLGCEYDLNWSSSNTELITDAGKVAPGLADAAVEVTAAIDGDLGQKVFSLQVPRRFVTAYFTPETMTADGDLKEYSWMAAASKEFADIGGEGAPTGAVSVLMNHGVAYVAVEFADAEALVLTLGEKSWTVDLTKATFSDTGIEGAIGEGVLELKIDMIALGMPIRDYNQTVKTELTLSKGQLSSSLDTDAIDIAFVPKAVLVPEDTTEPDDSTEPEEPTTNDPVAIPGDSGTLKSGVEVTDGALVYAGTMGSYGWEIWQYNDPNAELINLSKDMLLEQTLDIDTLAGKYYITYEDQTSATAKYAVRVAVYDSGDGTLSLTHCDKPGNAVGSPIALGKSVGGDAFKLGLLYSNKTVKVYVDGVLKGTISNSVSDVNFNGATRLDLRCNDATAKFTVSNIQVTAEPVISEPEVDPDVDLEVPVVTDITGANYTVSGVFAGTDAAKLTVSRPYWIKQPVDAIDFSQDMLIEQTLDVDGLTGTGVFTSADVADGLLIRIQESESAAEKAKALIAAVLYNDNGLKLKVLKNTDGTASDAIDLGKAVGADAFKLGIKYSTADNKITILVDGTEVGSVENGVVTYRAWGAKTFAYNYYTGTMGVHNTAAVSFSDIQITTYGEGETSVDTSNSEVVDMNMQFNVGGNFGYAAATDTLSYTLTGPATSIRYYVDKNSEQDTKIDPAKELLYEQTLTVTDMPVGESTMTGVRGGNGYIINMEDATNGILIAALLYNSGDDGLKLQLWKGTEASAAIALGKKTGEAFTLGLKWAPDATVTVYVDGEEKGSAQITAASMGKVQNGDSFGLYYQYAGCGADEKVTLAITDMKLTVTEPVVEETQAEVVDMNMQFNVIGNFGYAAATDTLSYSLTGPATSIRYCVDKNSEQDTKIDPAKELLYEQTLTVTDMPVGESTMTGVRGGNGYIINMEDATNGILIAALLYNSGDDGLKLQLWKGTEASSAIALGKKTGEEFTLGLKWAPDATVTVYVDGEEKGSAQITAASMGKVQNGDSFGLYYQYASCGADEKVTLAITDMKLTITEPVVEENEAEVVDMNMQFNVGGNFGYAAAADTLSYTLTGPATSIRYYVDKNSEQDTKIDPAKELLYEQTLTVTDMPVGESTMTGVRGGNGYIINMEDATNGILIAALLYNSGDDGLKLQLWKGTEASAAIALGKKTGEAFTLGLKWAPDATVTVYVDGEEKGSAQITAASMGKVQNGDSFGLYYQYAGCGAEEKVTLAITDMKLTITEPVSDDSGDSGEPEGTTTAISNANYTVSGLFVNNGTGAKLNVSRAYWFTQPANTGLEAVDFTKDMLLEQTLTVTKLPTSTGAFSNLADATHFSADGLLIRVQESKTAAEHASDLIAAALYNDGTSLKLNVLKADGTASDAIDLGKAVGATFKLGLRYNANDDTITVLVDDVEKGAVASGVYNFAAWGLKTVGYSYKDAQWAVTDAADVTIASIKLTTSEPEVPKGVVTAISGANYVVNGVFVNDGTGAKLTSSNGASVYWIKQPTTDPGLTAVDFTKDMLLEQTISITSLPVSAGTFVSAAQANGLQIKIQEAKAELVTEHAADFITAVIYNDGTSLKLKVMKADGTASDAIDLGKAAESGVSFKLGVEYSANDDTITVYVDGTEKGSVSNGVYNYANWVRKTVAYNYYDSEWETGDSAALTIDNIQLTVSEPEAVDPGEGEGGEGGDEDQLGGIAIPLTGTAANSGYAISGTTLSLQGSAAHQTHQKAVYWIQQTGLDAVDLNKDMLIEQTLTFNKMVAGDGSFLEAPVQVNGFNIVLEEAGQSFAANIFNSGSGLKMNVLKSDGKTEIIDLGVDLEDTFRLGLKRSYKDTLTVYVDGVEKGSVSGVSYSRAVYNKRTMLYYYRDANCVEGTEVDIAIKDIRLTVTVPTDIVLEDLAPLAEEISAEVLLDGIDLSAVTSDLTFPASYDSQWLGVLPLTWSSSNEDFLTSEGKVTRPSGKVNQYSLLTPTVVDGPVLWTTEATILTTGEQKEQTPVKIMTSYTAADEASSEGIDTKWSLSNKILADMEKNGTVLEGSAVAGIFGVRWGLENLYLAVSAGEQTLGITVNDVAVDLSNAAPDDKGITYITVPYADVDLDDPNEYGIEIPAAITLGEAKWEGVFQLTSNENFIIDGAAERVWTKMSPGTASVGTTKNDGNQGVKKTDTGWYFFDHYSPTGKNPELIRSYSVLWAKGSDNADYLATYEPFNDREHATYAEFDFYAESMPVYLDGVNSTGWSVSFASYGFTWALCASDGGVLQADGVSMGIYNTAEGLTFCVQNLDEVVKLNRYVGDHFRIGTRWNTDGSLTVYVDGQEIAHLEGAEKLYSSYGSNSLILNLIRNTEGPTGSQDNFDVYIDNIAIAKGNGDTALEFLTYEDLLNENEDRLAVTSDLILPTSATNEQTGWVTDITWTSDNEDVIDPATGKVTAPTEKGVLVTLSATGGGDEQVFQFYVQATDYESHILMAVGDTDTAHGAGFAKDVYEYTLDTDNSSIILDQGTSKTINVITLTDGDESNRLNESFLSIWVSDDNVTYTRVDEYFKLLRDGTKTYLYDFTATGRYIKVHAMHYDGAEADFVGPLENMIAASYEDVFAAEGDFAVSKDVTVTNSKGYTAYDDAWQIDLEAAGVASGTEASIRAYLGDELLYHYVEDGKLTVRIPEIAAGGSATVTVLSGNDAAADIANKDSVYEVVYGTRETMVDSPRRWICSLGDGRLFSVASDNNPAFDDYDWSTASDAVKGRRAQITWSVSYDGGLTWTNEEVITNAMSGNLEEDGWINSIGGITYDPYVGENGRLIFNGYYYVRFSKNNVTASFCQQRFMYSDDLGETWVRCPEMTQTGDTSYYNIGYDDVIRLSCFDGDGPNNDYIMTVADQANNDGGFCLRVVYSNDGGETWILGDDKVDLEEGSGITAIESGVSEGFLIETEDENGDPLLVLYSRCQYANSTKFAFSTSSDYGLTWEKATLSNIYASAGQPVMNPFGDANLMIWGGNHALGTNSYNIMPLTVGVLSDDMRSVSNIQDLYSRYSTQGMTDRTEVRVINQSADSNGDVMSITYWSRPSNLRVRVDHFTDFLYRTKGIYDSFEHSTVKYEGWAVTGGVVSVSGEQYVDGSKSMKFAIGAGAVRSIPYLQDGTVTFPLYVANAGSADFTVELEAAYSDIYGTAAPVAIKVVDGKVYMLKCEYTDGEKTIIDVDSGLTLADGWNEVTFDLNLSAETPTAKVSVNSGTAVAMPVDPSVGAYVCYLDINTIDTVLYADGVMAVDTMPEDVPEAPAEPTGCEIAHQLVKTDAVEATCDTDGNIDYWTCVRCGKIFSDNGGKTEITLADTVVKLDHNLVKVDVKAATCEADGNIAHWKCDKCGKCFADAEGKTGMAEEATVIKGGHALTKVEAKAATTTAEGNIAYWSCSKCGKYFSDAEGKTEITDKTSVILPMLKADVQPGKVENVTDAKENALGAMLSVPADQLDDLILTEVDKAHVANGEDIKIDLTVTDISKTVSAEDKALIASKLGDNKVGMYLDITLTKQIGDNAPVKITKTNGKVTVTIIVPENLRNTDSAIKRTYQIIRIHEGKADVLDTVYNAKTGELTFQTDLFSTYALVYKDTVVKADGPATGDGFRLVAAGTMMIFSALALTMMVLVPAKRRKSR